MIPLWEFLSKYEVKVGQEVHIGRRILNNTNYIYDEEYIIKTIDEKYITTTFNTDILFRKTKLYEKIKGSIGIGPHFIIPNLQEYKEWEDKFIATNIARLNINSRYNLIMDKMSSEDICKIKKIIDKY